MGGDVGAVPFDVPAAALALYLAADPGTRAAAQSAAWVARRFGGDAGALLRDRLRAAPFVVREKTGPKRDREGAARE